MPQDFEQMIRELLGESAERVTRFQREQIEKITTKVHELAREAVKPELSRMSAEIADLRGRIAQLEAEKAAAAEDGVEPPLG